MAERLILPSSDGPLRTINLISGGGSTNLSILQAERPGGILHGFTKTVAIISSDPTASGIQRAIDAGFPGEHIHWVDTAKNKIGGQLQILLNIYDPDFYYQLGWMPHTPVEALSRWIGLNQHYGPGGKWMYGERRPFAHRRFCEMVGEDRSVPVFAQLVAPEYDSGDAVYVEWTRLLPNETPEEAAKRILAIEHRVQIEARRLLAIETAVSFPLPRIALNDAEEALLLLAKKEARDKYPIH